MLVPPFSASRLLAKKYSIASSDFWSAWVWASLTTICSKSRTQERKALFDSHRDLLELNGKRFLVAPRGRTQWVRNAEAAGEVLLKKGRTRLRFRLRSLPDAEKPEILKAYLDAFKREAQTYFPVAAGFASSGIRSANFELPSF